MPTALLDRRFRYGAFLALALAINLVDSALVRSAAPAKRLAVTFGATFDLVIVISLLYYWLLVRPGLRGRATLLAVSLLGLLRATFLYSDSTTGKALVAGLCELGLIAFVVIQVRRRKASARRAGEQAVDPVDTMQAALENVLMSPLVARIVAAEISVLYYALFSWRAKPHIPSGAQPFSLHQKAGQADLFGLVAIASAVEIFPMRLVLRHWSNALAWVATGLGIYAAVWLLGLSRAFRLRPALVRPDALDLRYGLIFRLRVPREAIVRVRRAQAADKTEAKVLPSRSEPTLYIELAHPLRAEAMFGIRKQVHRIAISPDDTAAFERALAGLLEQSA